MKTSKNPRKYVLENKSLIFSQIPTSGTNHAQLFKYKILSNYIRLSDGK